MKIGDLNYGAFYSGLEPKLTGVNGFFILTIMGFESGYNKNFL